MNEGVNFSVDDPQAVAKLDHDTEMAAIAHHFAGTSPQPIATWVSRTSAAKLLKINYTKVDELIESGQLRYKVGYGGYRYVDEAQVRELVAQARERGER